MILRIENIGPLRDAEVDLSKRLIVLTGPNNTGKTYFAWSTYGLHRSVSGEPWELLSRYVDMLLGSPELGIDLGEILSRHYHELLTLAAADFSENIHHCFAAERARFEGARAALSGERPHEATERLARGGERVTFLARDNDLVGILHRSVQSTRAHFGLSTVEALRTMLNQLLDGANGAVVAEDTLKNLASMTPEVRETLHARLNGLVGATLRRSIFPPCSILPAERLAVNIFAKELALKRTELVDELVDADIEGLDQVPMDMIRRRTGRYPWPIRDSLRIANDLTRLSKDRSGFAHLAADIENTVLGGKVSVSGEGEMSFFPGDAPDKQLGIHLTASVVKSLSSLVFYFRHLAQAEDFLIIDEPELNLHPDNQRKLARILAKAVQRGFKLMISTHSDYVIRELNHMIMLSKLPGEEARELGYDPECALAPQDVGVYLFDEHTARSLPVTETGFSVPTIDEQINSLNTDAQRLYARLLDDGQPGT